MCACTEPVRTGIGAVCVEMDDLSGQLRCWITHTNTNTHTWYLVQNNVFFCFCFWHPMLVRPVIKSLFFPWKTNEEKARFARSPHYHQHPALVLYDSCRGTTSNTIRTSTYTGIHWFRHGTNTRCTAAAVLSSNSCHYPEILSRNKMPRHDQLSKSSKTPLHIKLLQKNARMFLFVELPFLRKLSNFATSGPVELLLAVFNFRFGRTRFFFSRFPYSAGTRISSADFYFEIV